MSTIYLGYDPGGNGSHGVAAINGNTSSSTTLETAQQAIDWFLAQSRTCGEVFIGVDTLTLWSTGPGGWRPADRALAIAYPAATLSIQSPNLQRGSMPINGALVIRLFQQSLPRLMVTETHPKVLYYALTGQLYDYPGEDHGMIDQLRQLVGRGELAIDSEHAWDALISAYAAKQWFTGQWPCDLHQLPKSNNEELLSVHNGEAHYGWPKSLAHQDKVPERSNRNSQRN